MPKMQPNQIVKNRTVAITVNEELFRGLPENLIKTMEARGYQAERDEQNPHIYWQWSEHFKKVYESDK